MNIKAVLGALRDGCRDRRRPGHCKGRFAEANSAKLSLKDAIAMAEKQGNGKAIDAEIESKGATAAYAVEVLSNDGKTLMEYKLDVNTGQTRDSKNEAIEKIFTRAKPQDIASAATSLSDAITVAEQQTGGKVIELRAD